MIKEYEAYVKMVGELILGWMCKAPSSRIPKRVKYKIVGLYKEPVYVIETYPDDVAVKLTDKGFRREARWYEC